MSQLAIDPIGYSEAPQKAGMPKEQADLIAKTQEAKIDKLIEVRELATKADLRELEMRLAARLNETQINMLNQMDVLHVCRFRRHAHRVNGLADAAVTIPA